MSSRDDFQTFSPQPEGWQVPSLIALKLQWATSLKVDPKEHRVNRIVRMIQVLADGKTHCLIVSSAALAPTATAAPLHSLKPCTAPPV